jgi:hypothetical protein
MWAHYADAHRGVCLVFDRAALDQQVAESFADRLHLPVEYVSGFDDVLAEAELVSFDQLDTDAHFRRTVLATLGRKNADWENESEYRIAVIDEPGLSCILPVADSLVGLVLGVDFSESQLPLAEAICHRFSIGDAVSQVSINNAVLDVVPARAPDGRLVKWADDDIRAGRMFEVD